MPEDLMDLMKAVLLTGHGGLGQLEYRTDVPVPTPGPDDVLVKVGAAGINNTDVWTREGAYGRTDDPYAVSGWRRGGALEFPRVQGGDIAGRIVEVGADIDPHRVGQRVLVDFTLYGDQGDDQGDGLIDAGLIGSERDGGFAEYVSVPAENAHAIETSLSDAELATFPIAYVTAERMLNRARLSAGETIVVTGASGGVGSALVQLARRRDARVAALTGPGKGPQLRALGAEIVLPRDRDDWPQRLHNELGERAIDVAADVVGGALFGTLLEVLRPEGRYVTAGAIAGPIVDLDLRTLYLKHLELIGSTMGTRREFSDLVRYIESNQIRPLLARTYPLSEIKQAQTDFLEKRFFGKLVVTPE